MDCPSPDKAAHASRRDAEIEQAKLDAQAGINLGRRAYRCVCGKWHVGRRNKSPSLERQLKSAIVHGKRAGRRRRRP